MAVQSAIFTSGTASVTTRSASIGEHLRRLTRTDRALPGLPVSPPLATAGSSGIRAEQGHTDLAGQALASAAAEQRVLVAVIAGEARHVLDHAGHPEVSLAGHVRGAGRDLLSGERRRRDDDHLGAGEHAGETHLDVAGARREIDEEVVEGSGVLLGSRPGDVLDEVLKGTVEDEAPPHDRFLLLGEEAHRHEPELDLRRSEPRPE